ncbi:phage tail fiber C-terminal domain-containing protein [Escherichia coli]|uniref:phage tail fiber C-terminal domain-containing protein n=1 Tax=Escherichia coli TaxID=562 RepID=UPI0032E9EC66
MQSQCQTVFYNLECRASHSIQFHGWFPDTDGALITGLTFLDPKDATRVQGFFQHLQVRFGDGPWQDVKGLDEVGSDTGRTGE